MSFVAAILAIGLQTQTVTLHEPFQRVDRLLAKLSELSGTKHSAAPALSEEVVFAWCDDVPQTDLRTKIGELVLGEWVAEDGAWLLRPDPRAVNRAIRERNETRKRIVARSIAKMSVGVEAVKPQSVKDALARVMEWAHKPRPADIDEQIEGWRNSPPVPSPEHNLSKRMLAYLDVDALATTVPGQTAVFSHTRTPICEPYRAGYRSAIDAYVRERSVFDDALALQPRSGTKPFERLTDAPETLQAITYVSVESPWWQGQMSCETVVLDRQGRQLVGTRESEYESEEHKVTQPDHAAILQKLAATTEGKPKGLAGALWHRLFPPDEDTRRPPVQFTDEEAYQIAHPEQFDPFNLTVGPALEYLAVHSKRPILALAPYNTSPAAYLDTEFAGDEAAEFLGNCLRFRESENWVVAGSPVDWTDARPSRALLGNYARSLFTEAGPDVRDLVRVTSVWEFPLAFLLQEAPFSSRYLCLSWFEDVNRVCTMLPELSASEWAAALGGSALEVSRLNPRAASALSKAMFSFGPFTEWDGAMDDVPGEDEDYEEPDPIMESFEQMTTCCRYDRKPYSDGIALYPNGLPASAVVRLTRKPELAVMVNVKGNALPLLTSFRPPERYALREMIPASAQTYTLTLDMGDGRTATGLIEMFSKDPKAVFLPLDKLPKDFMDAWRRQHSGG